MQVPLPGTTSPIALVLPNLPNHSSTNHAPLVHIFLIPQFPLSNCLTCYDAEVTQLGAAKCHPLFLVHRSGSSVIIVTATSWTSQVDYRQGHFHSVLTDSGAILVSHPMGTGDKATAARSSDPRSTEVNSSKLTVNRIHSRYSQRVDKLRRVIAVPSPFLLTNNRIERLHYNYTV
jgi:hypothetical protein